MDAGVGGGRAVTALPRNAKVDSQKKFWRRQLLASKSNHRLPFPPPRMPPTAPFLSLTLTWGEIARRSPTTCRTCEFHFASHGVPCLDHTRADERAARARTIGAVR